MRSGKPVLAVAGLMVCGAFLIRGELAPWVQHTPAGPAIAALFRTVAMPGGAVPVLRPPSEARPALTKLIGASPRDAMLFRLRAQEAEVALDFAGAETDWKSYARLSADRYGAQIEVADFYQRRMQPRDELSALWAATAVKDDPLLAASAQRGWRAFERMANVVEQNDLPELAAGPAFRAWVARYPQQPEAWNKLIAHLIANRQFGAAEIEIVNYSRTFHDATAPVRMRAELELGRGAPDAALAIYDRAFQPLWPDDMRRGYFKLLEEQGHLRDFAGRARTALAANPADLDATARLFHYFRSQNNNAAARRALLEYRIAKESGKSPWTANELETTAQLFEWLPDVNEAARLYYALYSAPPANGPQAERALHGLANLLLTSPEQPIQFGSGDLSFYRDIATVDASPGFLNGILSLVLNWTGPRGEYRIQNEKSAAYFHRAAAAQLVTLLDQRFPKSEYRGPLHAALITAYGVYGDDADVIRGSREYLAAFPAGADRVQVAMQVSDALARANRSSEEFALYDQILRELGRKASGAPIGSGTSAAPTIGDGANNVDNHAPLDRLLGVPMVGQVGTLPVSRFGGMRLAAADAGQRNAAGPRSSDYAQVLDKYLSRLIGMKQPLEALRVYRTEIDRNPNDAGLYERLAAFLEQNGMTSDIEGVYIKAIAKFPEHSWYDKLARWYLRHQQASAFATVTQEVVAIFSGAELERYFAELVNQVHPDAVLYRQLNLYAHERFPEDLVFVRNLMSAYARPETLDRAASEHLLRQYWFYDPQLQAALFERLSREGRLDAELAQIRAANPGIVNGQLDQALARNPAAVQFAAQAEAWLSHFEAAAPAARALAAAYPGRTEFTEKASSLYRSLAAYDNRNTEIALTLAGYQQGANPRDQAVLARMGDILADRELFTRARTYWERMPAEQPGKPDVYLDAATIYWDYYRYNDALRLIGTARKKFDDPALFAYQAGAIYEGKRDYASAVREYLAGALDRNDSAENRLLRLGSRPQTRDRVDRATASAVAADPSPQAVALRVALLEAQQRRPALEALLQARVAAEKSSAELTWLQETARRLGFGTTEEHASERLAEVTADPVDKMRLTLGVARLLESKKNIIGAARTVDALYRDHSLILGVVRGAADFHVRNHQPAEAIDILLDASKHARADLAAQFTLESARIATAAGQVDRARGLLTALLAVDPVRTDFQTAMADTYLQAKDDRGFRDYQLETIRQWKQSSLSAVDRAERIATLRRSLIPALDRMNDSAGAVDQYIEVINSYAEDEALTKEAAAYAVAHNQTARLIAFYRKTIAEAPLDYRWPVVLGRIETAAEDYPAAIADYERAIQARPDRADIFQAKGRLEERLMRFEDGIKTYSRLYELAYRDPQWLTKVAELQARLGKTAQAVASLKTAIIGARTETYDADFEIAAQLEGWHILPEAIAYCERGANLIGPELFQHTDEATTYARIMAKARRMDVVLKRLGSNVGDAPASQTAGEVIRETYTPEEKLRFDQLISAEATRVGREARDANLLPLVNAAGMVELEARWRRDSMEAQSQLVDQHFVNLQQRRGVFGELARQLEEFAVKIPGRPAEDPALAQAAREFVDEGDIEGQIRVMRKDMARNALAGDLLERYLALMAARQPDELVSIARSNGSSDIRNRAVQAAIASDRQDLAYSAVQARGAGQPPVWSKAYTALAGQYFNDHAPAIDAAFQSALDTRTIGERLKAPLKPDSVIVGSVWFYYGGRYGDYLAAGHNPEADAWMPATLEAAPGNPTAYMTLGDSYAAAGQPAKAIAQFEHALELDADRGDAHDHIARLLSQQGRQADAVAEWKLALATFLRIQGRGVRVPEPFWGRVAETFNDAGERHALSALRAEIANLLGDYYQRNGQYRLGELIEAAARASIESGEGTSWLIELGRSMDHPDTILIALMNAPSITQPQRIALQRDIVAIRDKSLESSFGDARTMALSTATGARLQLVRMLLESGDVRGATVEWGRLPAAASPRREWDSDSVRDELEIRLASKTATLQNLIERYASQASAAPFPDSLRKAAMALRRDGDEKGAQAVMEFLYERELSKAHLDAANFIGLAEVKLQRNETAAAVALLNRMALVIYDGSDSLLPAAKLLVRYGRTAEAADFIRRRATAVPWDAEAKVQLARTMAPASAEREQLLTAVLMDAQAAYKLRADAARLAGPRAASVIPGTELALLASGASRASDAAKPYQVEARIDAAGTNSDAEVKLRLWRDALALSPSDDRVRLGVVRAALAARRDRLALTLEARARERVELAVANPDGSGVEEFPQYLSPRPAPLPFAALTGEEHAALAQSLAEAAERIDDLAVAQAHWREAIELRPPAQQAPLGRHLDALVAEQERRIANAARQPAVKNVIEQDHLVLPRISRSAQ